VEDAPALVIFHERHYASFFIFGGHSTWAEAGKHDPGGNTVGGFHYCRRALQRYLVGTLALSGAPSWNSARLSS
jgi:hypothetical protein